MDDSRGIYSTLLQGAIAGLGGALGMSTFTRLWNGVSKSDRRKNEGQRLAYSAQERDASERMAEIIASQLFGQRLSKRQRRAGSAAVHYAVGAVTGAAYAMIAERFPSARRFSGALFGATMWWIADEILIPAAGISAPLRDYSIAEQANALGEHIVFGVMAEGFLRLTRKSGSRQIITPNQGTLTLRDCAVCWRYARPSMHESSR